MSAAKDRRREIVDLTVELANINSVNPTLDPRGPGEAEVGRCVEQWMRAQGWEVHVEWPAPGRPNVIGVIEGGPGPTLMVNAHLDTVGADAAALKVSATDDVIVGRGVLDTKGGLAAALLAARAAAAMDPPGNIVIAAVSDEEADSLGTEMLLQGWDVDAAVVIEPCDLAVIIGHRGFGVVEVTWQGRAAHTAQREEGINAIDGFVSCANRLAALDASLAARSPHPTLGHATVQVTRVKGGAETFTVPDQCSAVVEIRTVPETESEDMDAVIEILESPDTGSSVVVRGLTQRHPFEIDRDHGFVGQVEASLRAGGAKPVVDVAPFWTDAALLGAKGTPAVVLGPGGGGIHSDHEWVNINDLETCRNVLQDLMLRFGGSGLKSGAEPAPR